MKYKITYYIGEKIGISTKVDNAYLFIKDKKVYISSSNGDTIYIDNITNIEMFRLYGLGRMLKIELVDKTVFVSVVRICIGNIFAIINFKKTGELFNILNKVLVR